MTNFKELFEAKDVEIEVDWVADEGTKEYVEKKYKLKVELDTDSMDNVDIATITGKKENIRKYMLKDYQMDKSQLKDEFPELF